MKEYVLILANPRVEVPIKADSFFVDDAGTACFRDDAGWVACAVANGHWRSVHIKGAVQCEREAK